MEKDEGKEGTIIMREDAGNGCYDGGRSREDMFGECHAHIFMDGVNYREAVQRHLHGVDDRVIRRHFKMYREKGITFVRDGGDDLGVSERAREIAGEYGIDYRTPIFAIHRKGCYGGIVGKAYENMKEYAELIREVKAHKGDFIKIMTTGIMDFDTDGGITGEALPYAEVKEMVHIAHEEGFAVMCHTNGAGPVADLVRAGADSVEHGNYVSEETLLMMAESDIVWVPTITVVANMFGCGRFSDELLHEIYELGKKNIRRALELGVHMALGSDAGAYLVPHGQGLLDEWGCFQECAEDEDVLKARIFEGEEKIRKKFRFF